MSYDITAKELNNINSTKGGLITAKELQDQVNKNNITFDRCYVVDNTSISNKQLFDTRPNRVILYTPASKYEKPRYILPALML